MARRIILTVAMIIGIFTVGVAPVAAHNKPPAPAFIEVIETSFESPGWARYPIDIIYGQGIQVRYNGSERASFVCRTESGEVVWSSGPQILTGEGGPGVSVFIDYSFAASPASYYLCDANLLETRGKKDRVIATDPFIIYLPV